MNSRQKILNDLQQASVPEAALPDLAGDWTTYPDPKQHFTEVLESVGGHAVECADDAAIAAALNQLEAFSKASQIWSLVPGIDSTGGDWGQLSDPHELEKLDCCVVPGDFAVAENGAVWLTDTAISHRAALFVTQHLVLVVAADRIVHNMHEAYSRIPFEHARFGVFISGPSKTADIEQSLVIGAHGARSLSVLLVGS